ncbi:MAG: SDR family NAD(P)-dependent oxidoreductase [Actinomycetota bacterium]|nr:SDR family NAD(P)-dependent oxidoreductase [Actinomycetota bacterium]
MTAPACPVTLRGGRALVTGASSGIGAATARALANEGVSVALAGRDSTALASVAADAGGPAFAGDLTEPGYPARLAADASAALGGLDIVVSNAGAGWAGPFSEMDPAGIDGLIDLNLRAPAHLLHAALPDLVAKGRGHVVLVGSIAGLVGVPNEAVYSATKAGLAGLAEALRAELTGTGVKVSVVSPGVVDTAFFSRRNRPYDRTRPAPIPAAEVADAIVDCLRFGRPEVIVPSWLAVPARIRGMAPRAYRALAQRLA